MPAAVASGLPGGNSTVGQIENAQQSGLYVAAGAKQTLKNNKKAGLYFVLNMHLSDTWAEPQDQRIPAAWQKLSFPQLQKRLEAYCQRVISTLRKGHAMPDMVTLRNEINRGILFPQGRLRVNGKPRWNRFTSLLNPAIAGVYAGSGSHKPKIMLQVGDFPDPLKFFQTFIKGSLVSAGY